MSANVTIGGGGVGGQTQLELDISSAHQSIQICQVKL